MVFVLRIVRFTPCLLLEQSPHSARCGATSQKGAPHVQGTDRFLAADRPPAAPHVPPLGETLQRQPPGPELHLLGAVPGDGLRPAHLPREPTRLSKADYLGGTIPRCLRPHGRRIVPRPYFLEPAVLYIPSTAMYNAAMYTRVSSLAPRDA